MTITVLRKLFECGETKGMKKGLDNVLKLDALLGFPSRCFSSIHVGGTNGKGSVSTKIARSLQVEQKKIALYTSPHLISFCERIEVNGTSIEEAQAERLLKTIFRAAELSALQPTFFELLTLLSFLYFAEQDVDHAVFEVGMGGRWDATNIINPLLSVITSIDWDHTQYLGRTLDAIAFEKGGIIKPNRPVILGPKAAEMQILFKLAQERNSPIHSVTGPFLHYEEENRAIAQKAVDILNLPYSEKGIFCTPRCRFQIYKREVPIVLDVGHNPGALKALLHRLTLDYSNKSLAIVTAFSSDKEISPSLEILKEAKGRLFFYRVTF